jgi:nucleotide-binding universal stress UspA family protein
MPELKGILCPVDLSDLSLRALPYASAIAHWYDGNVAALHVVPTFEPMEVRVGALFDPVQFVYPVPREQVVERLREAVASAGVAGERITPAAEAGDPATVIVDQALARKSDLVVMATHGRSGFDRLLLGSVTEKVLRRASCPVLTVPVHAPSAGSDVTPRHILCPIDQSSAALQALGFAVDLARRTGAPLTVVQVIEWLAEEEPRQRAHYNVPEFRGQLIQDADERLKALVAQQPDVAAGIRTRVLAGRAYREILRVAADGRADLIVMGAQGRGGPALMLLGSTTQQVVRAAACPVLTVRAPLGE